MASPLAGASSPDRNGIDAPVAMLPGRRGQRARSTSASRTAQLAHAQPDIDAGFGIEKETADILFNPGGRRHGVIGVLPNSQMEIDDNDVDDKSHLEFVGRPVQGSSVVDSADFIAAANRAEAALVQSIRDAVGHSTARAWPPVKAIGLPMAVADGQRHQRI